ncbi:MAG: NAD(P)H-dependent glycerol-3-phosphate dehydrogenase [Nitrososphaerales archaeon]
MANVTILGAGLMGTAVAWPLVDNGHEVRLVGTHLDTAIIRSCLDRGWHPRLKRQLPDGIMPYYVEELPKALEGADLIVSGVNSLGVRWIAHTLGPLLWPGATIIAVTKGLEADANGALRILPDLFHDELPEGIRDQVSLNAIGGPCIAGELAGRRNTCVVFTGRDGETLSRLRSIFAGKYYHIWTSTDIVGVEVCAALKNAYTLAVGMATGMLDLEGGPDDAGAGTHNVAAALFGASAREMTRIVGLMGGGIENVPWLPGVGDQYVTCVGGRTIRMGRLLGAGLTYTESVLQMAGETLEGIYMVKQMAQVLPEWEGQGKIARHELPLMRMLCRVVNEDAKADIPFDRLFD